MAEDAFTIRAEPWRGREAAALRAELEAELRLRYGQGSASAPEPGSIARSAGRSDAGRPDGAPTNRPPDTTDPDPRVFLIAWDRDGQALGCGALGPVGHDTFQIKRMFVRPNARRRGVARALLAALEEQAVRAGACWIVLETGPMQREAISLYLSTGYGPIPGPGAPTGERRSMCFGRTAPRVALR